MVTLTSRPKYYMIDCPRIFMSIGLLSTIMNDFLSVSTFIPDLPMR